MEVDISESQDQEVLQLGVDQQNALKIVSFIENPEEVQQVPVEVYNSKGTASFKRATTARLVNCIYPVPIRVDNLKELTLIKLRLERRTLDSTLSNHSHWSGLKRHQA